VIGGWVGEWLPLALGAAAALAPLAAEAPTGVDAEEALGRVRAYAREMLSGAGLRVDGDWEASFEAAGPDARAPVRRRRAPGHVARRAAPAPVIPTAGGDTYDYVGIVMAKSAEGDAVAAILGERLEIEVIEQPSFWDIRAPGRLVIPYGEVSERLGYEIDAYSIQHEMSTHYGRMVAADDALMLFSDPTEAMQYLMA
jgi:hypothetical protein